MMQLRLLRDFLYWNILLTYLPKVAAVPEVGCDGIPGSGQRLDRCGICGGDNSGCKKVDGLFIRENLGSGYVDVAEIPVGATNINITEVQRSRNYIVLINKATGLSIINGNWTLSRTGPHRAAGAEFRYLHPRYSLNGESVYAQGPLTSAVQLMLLAQGSANPGVRYSYISQIVAPWQQDPNSVQSAPNSFEQSPVSDDAQNLLLVDSDSSQRQMKDAAADYAQILQSKDIDDDEVDGTPSPGVLVNRRIGAGVATQEGPGITRVKIAASGLFLWKLTKPSNCTQPCGGGTSVARAVCVQTLSSIVVTDENCLEIKKPDEYSVPCNTQSCPPAWVTAEWSECSETCGAGMQRRQVACRQRLSPAQIVSRPASECTDRRPAIMQMCKERPCHSWLIGEWGQCSAKCGDGQQKRTVHCVKASGGRVDNSKCSQAKPQHIRRCVGDCVRSWLHSAWSNKCSADCDAGFIERQVYCPADNHVFTGRSECGARPLTSRRCATLTKCGGQWFTGPWRECVGPCNDGIQTREVYCMIQHGPRHWHSVTYDTQCPMELKPPSSQQCQSQACFARPQWFISDWGACSETCGRGYMKRSVQCLDSRFRPSPDCNQDNKPKTEIVCRNDDCDQRTDILPDESNCGDTYRNCRKAAQAGLCRLSVFKDNCCHSCYGH